jgi:hypothetical protein
MRNPSSTTESSVFWDAMPWDPVKLFTATDVRTSNPIFWILIWCAKAHSKSRRTYVFERPNNAIVDSNSTRGMDM